MARCWLAGRRSSVFIHRHRLPGLAFADLIAPGVVLGVGLGRIGCFLNGCCYGGICELPWAVQFPEGTPAYADQAQLGMIPIHGLVFRGSPRRSADRGKRGGRLARRAARHQAGRSYHHGQWRARV